ncbi:hypothetical protein BBAL3_2518 [Brevundimonas sp. BAL3]|nr:hypothetical protein BBAL3_2518 [Brevundimonas sp. BAL3]
MTASTAQRRADFAPMMVFALWPMPSRSRTYGAVREVGPSEPAAARQWRWARTQP